ncbi:MAG TPA: hypothetical protein VNJ04_13570, partial [Gemmatimonadaceae bacterium]|nr:hypothetical protein [Gemmatimonadaceae bacterium]
VTKLESAGFEVLRVTSFISVLLPLMALSRWRDARKTRGPSASELHVSPPVNTALRAALTAERALIRAGLSFPAGGSLFVIARRASGPAEALPRRRPDDQEDQEKDGDCGCRRLG